MKIKLNNKYILRLELQKSMKTAAILLCRVLLGNIYFSGLTLYDFWSVSLEMLYLMCMPEEIHNKGACFSSQGIHT